MGRFFLPHLLPPLPPPSWFNLVLDGSLLPPLPVCWLALFCFLPLSPPPAKCNAKSGKGQKRRKKEKESPPNARDGENNQKKSVFSSYQTAESATN